MSKIFYGMIGFIVGDAMGVPTEFCIREKLLENLVTEMIEFGSHPVPLKEPKGSIFVYIKGF